MSRSERLTIPKLTINEQTTPIQAATTHLSPAANGLAGLVRASKAWRSLQGLFSLCKFVFMVWHIIHYNGVWPLIISSIFILFFQWAYMARLAWLFVLDEAGIKPMHFMPQNLRALGDRPARFSFSFCLFFVFFFGFGPFLYSDPWHGRWPILNNFSLFGFGSGRRYYCYQSFMGATNGKGNGGV